MYYFVLAIFLVGFAIIVSAPIHSPFGQVLKAIRENEPRADLARLPTPITTSCSPSSCRRRLAGLAGSTKALVFQLASLTDVHWTISGDGAC